MASYIASSGEAAGVELRLEIPIKRRRLPELFPLKEHERSIRMDWQSEDPGQTPEGRPTCKGWLVLRNDKSEKLASIMWFEDEGPFYCFAVDPSEAKDGIIRRIGPVRELASAKEVCLRGIEGRIENLTRRAGYSRS